MNNISLKKTPINRPDIPNIKFDEFKERTKHEKIDFKKSFNSWLDPKGISVITSSGKMAIHLLFKCLNLEGNVLTSPLSCAMTYAPIVATGTKLKFIDTDPHNFLIDVNKIEDKIDSNTKAIYIVHLGGMMPDMLKIREIADKYRLLLIEDCAQALGSYYNSCKAGTFGDFSCFSFSKNIWLSGGGAVHSKSNNHIIRQIKVLNDAMPYTEEPLVKYRFERDSIESMRGIDFNYDLKYYNDFLSTNKNANIDIDYNSYFNKKGVASRISNLQETILQIQFKEIQNKNEKRFNNALKIMEGLKDYGKFQTSTNCKSVYSKLYFIPKKRISNNELINKLFTLGIDAKHLTKSHGIHLQKRFDLNPYFKEYFLNDTLKNYNDIHDRIIALPISSNLSKDEIKFIIEKIKIELNDK